MSMCYIHELDTDGQKEKHSSDACKITECYLPERIIVFSINNMSFSVNSVMIRQFVSSLLRYGQSCSNFSVVVILHSDIRGVRKDQERNNYSYK